MNRLLLTKYKCHRNFKKRVIIFIKMQGNVRELYRNLDNSIVLRKMYASYFSRRAPFWVRTVSSPYWYMPEYSKRPYLY